MERERQVYAREPRRCRDGGKLPSRRSGQ